MRTLVASFLLSLSLAGGSKYLGIPLVPATGPGVNRAVPGAWIIVGQHAIHATQGSYCFGRACVDLANVQLLPRVASAQVGGASTVVVVRSLIRSASAVIVPWNSGSGKPRRVRVRIEHAGHLTVLSLHFPNPARNAVLRVSVSFPPRFHVSKHHLVGGSSQYIWRLNP
ncbi:MAG: hypothetical protein M3Z66_16985 [Chloroflexota bacterium]|nr:hypothetical protein [Chloroflexota bacterium]